MILLLHVGSFYQLLFAMLQLLANFDSREHLSFFLLERGAERFG
jgi:hypothetical protein